MLHEIVVVQLDVLHVAPLSRKQVTAISVPYQTYYIHVQASDGTLQTVATTAFGVAAVAQPIAVAPAQLSDVQEGGWTIAEMRDHAFFLADERAGAVFSEPDVERLINMGIDVIYREVGYPIATAIADVAPVQKDVTLTDAFVAVGGAADVKGVLLRSLDGSVTTLREGARVGEPKLGKPRSYSLRGETLTLDTLPDAPYQLEVTYRYMPPRYGAGDTPALSHDQMELAAIYAVHQMKLKDDQLSTADRWKELFDQRLRLINAGETGVFLYEGV